MTTGTKIRKTTIMSIVCIGLGGCVAMWDDEDVDILSEDSAFLGEDPITGEAVFANIDDRTIRLVNGIADAEASPDGEWEPHLTRVCQLYPYLTCSGSEVTKYGSGSRTYYRANMNYASRNYRRIDVFARICNPSGWVLHLSDSPTGNGYGGDAATTDHDAEGYIYNGTSYGFNSSYDWSRRIHNTSNYGHKALPASGCSDIQMSSYQSPNSSDGRFLIKNLTTGETLTDIRTPWSLRLGYNTCPSLSSSQRSVECDWENRSRSDQYLWYVGLNRTVGSSGRSGNGVSKACAVFNTSISSSPASCLSLASQKPESTNKR